MEKEEILEESTEQQVTIEESRDRHKISQELVSIGDAIKKEIRSFELQDGKLNQLETNDRVIRRQKSQLLINHINKMRKLHEKQAAIYDEFLKCKLKK